MNKEKVRCGDCECWQPRTQNPDEPMGDCQFYPKPIEKYIGEGCFQGISKKKILNEDRKKEMII